MPHPRPRARLLALALTAVAQPGLAADVEAMCERSSWANEDPTACRCALEALSAEVPADDFALYAEVGAGYFDGLDAGLGRAEAWDAAAVTAGASRGMSLIDVLEVTNPIGRMHAGTLKACD